MTSPEKSRAQLLAEIGARMMYTPDLFDKACERAAENIDKLDPAKLALLVRPKHFTPAQIDLILKIFPPDRPMPNGNDTTES